MCTAIDIYCLLSARSVPVVKRAHFMYIPWYVLSVVTPLQQSEACNVDNLIEKKVI